MRIEVSNVHEIRWWSWWEAKRTMYCEDKRNPKIFILLNISIIAHLVPGPSLLENGGSLWWLGLLFSILKNVIISIRGQRVFVPLYWSLRGTYPSKHTIMVYFTRLKHLNCNTEENISIWQSQLVFNTSPEPLTEGTVVYSPFLLQIYTFGKWLPSPLKATAST